MAVELSVVIPCYGHAAELEGCLRALMDQQTHVDYEVIVVDSSPDSFIETVTSRFPRVRLIRSQTRLLQGRARNLGVRNAASDRIAFTDADCIPSPQWVEQAYQSMEKGNALIGGPITDAHPSHPIAWVDNRFQFSDFQRGRPAGKIKHIPSCNMALSKLLFDELGGFREDVQTGEDTLLTIQLGEQTQKDIWFNPSMAVQHHGRRIWHEFLAHQRLHGYYRGLLRLFISDSLDGLARNPMLVWTMVPRRLVYMGLRTLQYDPQGLLRFIISLPLIIIGLIVWTSGFYQGIMQRNKGS
jgi:GT2 family glycosyltransferase